MGSGAIALAFRWMCAEAVDAEDLERLGQRCERHSKTRS